MSQMEMEERLALKTPEARFLYVLQREFSFSFRESREVLEAAQELLGLDRPTGQVQPGQVRLVVARSTAPFGPSLADTEKIEVTLTVDAGAEDSAVLLEGGREALRRGRILRVLEEALEQEGVLTEEDLARVLQVTRRTIERDVQALRAEGHLIHTRGQLKGVGRGQTHKVKIIALWLQRQGYDKIARWVHHSPQSIKRYVTLFLRIVALQQRGRPQGEIGFLVGATPRLVEDYLALYARVREDPEALAKLEEELERVCGVEEKGGLR